VPLLFPSMASARLHGGGPRSLPAWCSRRQLLVPCRYPVSRYEMGPHSSTTQRTRRVVAHRPDAEGAEDSRNVCWSEKAPGWRRACPVVPQEGTRQATARAASEAASLGPRKAGETPAPQSLIPPAPQSLIPPAPQSRLHHNPSSQAVVASLCRFRCPLFGRRQPVVVPMMADPSRRA
jgi:hypothetical protein